MFPPYWTISLSLYLVLCQSREKQVSITTTQGLSFALIKTGFCPLQLPRPAKKPAQVLAHIRLSTVPALWLTPDKQSGSQQSKGVRSPICQNCEYVSACNYTGRSFSLSATENGEPPFWWYSLGRRARWKREREGRRKGGSEGGRSVNCNQAAQHVRSWT